MGFEGAFSLLNKMHFVKDAERKDEASLQRRKKMSKKKIYISSICNHKKTRSPGSFMAER